MWTTVKSWALVASSALLMAGCGGGSDTPTPHGAIAFDAGVPSAYIATNFISQEKANAGAVTRCGGGGCAVVLEFAGHGSCGALATGGGTTIVWGAASGATQAEAEAGAVAACSGKGGVNCQIPSAIPGKCQ